MASDPGGHDTRAHPALGDRSRLWPLRHAVPVLAVVAGGALLLGSFTDPRSLALRVHYLGMGLLFVFLTFGELCCLTIALRGRRDSGWSSAVRPATWWRATTEAVPAAAAILLLASGLRLLLEGGHSLRSPWLLLLVVGFGFFLGDGIFGYTRDVRDLHGLVLEAARGGETGGLRRFLRHPGFHGMRLLHYVSLPILFFVGHQKVPGRLPLLEAPIAALEGALLPLAGRMTGVTMVLLLVGLEVGFIALLRRRGRGGV